MENTENKLIEIKPFHQFMELEEEDVEEAPSVMDVDFEQLLQDAQKEATLMLQEAKEQAAFIQTELEKEKEQWLNIERRKLEEEAKQVGYEEGHEMGKQQGYDECQEHIQFAQTIVLSAKEDYQQYLQSAEKTILDLAVQIAKKIIDLELHANEEAYIQLVKKAIKDTRECDYVQLRVHPVQYDAVLSHKEELSSIFPKENQFFIFPDDELKETSCIIEASNGRIDASIDSQLLEIKQKSLELLEGE